MEGNKMKNNHRREWDRLTGWTDVHIQRRREVFRLLRVSSMLTKTKEKKHTTYTKGTKTREKLFLRKKRLIDHLEGHPIFIRFPHTINFKLTVGL